MPLHLTDGFITECEEILINQAAAPGQDSERAAQSLYTRDFCMLALRAAETDDPTVIGAAFSAALRAVGILYSSIIAGTGSVDNKGSKFARTVTISMLDGCEAKAREGFAEEEAQQ